MAKLKDLKDLVQNVNLTEEQIAELLTIIIDMKKKNENADKRCTRKSGIPKIEI